MVWFLASLLLISLLVAGCHAAGWLLLGTMPWKLRPQARASLSVVVGLACLIMVLVPAGWFGPGFSHPLLRLAGVALILIPFFLAWRASSGRWLRACLGDVLLAVVCTLPFTLQLLRFGAFDALNDPWTYMVQSQWFQHHGLIEKVSPSNSTAVLTQVYFTQITQTRAVAQFALAFTQGLFGLPWGHQAYPATVCLFYAAGAVAVAYPLRLRQARPRWLAPLFVLIFATTLNGFTFGAIRGYLPQTAGLSLALAAILISASLMACHGTVRRGALLTGGMLFSAAVFTYSEILPFLVLAAGCIVLCSLVMRWPDRRTLYWRTGGLLLAFLLLSNIELWRATKAIIGQAKAVVGEGIPWSNTDFVAHAAGARAGYADGGVWWGGGPWCAATLTCVIMALAGAALFRCRRQAVLLAPLAGLLGVSAGLFVYYRYAAPNPFAVGQGQSWSQFKLANWSSIFLFCAAASGLGGILRKSMIPVVLLAGSVLVAVGLVQAWQLSELRTSRLREEVGRESDPFETLVDLSQEIKATATPPVFLDFPPPRAKSRQLLAYLLPYGSTTADWADDVFVSWMLAEPERHAARLQARWVVRHAEERTLGTHVARLGNYVLSEQQFIELPLIKTTGGYPAEINVEGRLNWVRDSISYEFSLPPGFDQTNVRLEAEIISLVPGLEFTLTSRQGADTQAQIIKMPESHQAWSVTPHLKRSLPLSPQSGKLLIEFRTTMTPGVIGGNDQRELTFLIRNLRVWLDRPVPSATTP